MLKMRRDCFCLLLLYRGELFALRTGRFLGSVIALHRIEKILVARFADECFDAVTSNYVYHNISGVDKQKLLRETLRVLKKGGTFAIHDLMEKSRYGDMENFVEELRAEGYEEVCLIPTANGRFMSKREGRCYFLAGSTLLVGKK